MYGFQIIIIEGGGINNLRRWIPSSGLDQHIFQTFDFGNHNSSKW
jgi:hypothetical protein